MNNSLFSAGTNNDLQILRILRPCRWVETIALHIAVYDTEIYVYSVVFRHSKADRVLIKHCVMSQGWGAPHV